MTLPILLIEIHSGMNQLVSDHLRVSIMLIEDTKEFVESCILVLIEDVDVRVFLGFRLGMTHLQDFLGHFTVEVECRDVERAAVLSVA